MAWFKNTDETPQDRRRMRRIQWTPESSLRVELSMRDGKTVPVRWIDLSVTGVKLQLPDSIEHGLRQGRPVRLVFRDADYEFRINGSVVWMRPAADEEEASLLGVHFAYVPQEIGEERPLLWEYFTRRQAYRVSPPANAPVRVLLACKEGVLATTLHDISATGMSVLIEPAGAAVPWVAAGLGAKYEVELHLPTMEKPQTVMARAERTERRGRHVVWRMSFSEEDEKEAGETVLRIGEYVTRRQQEAMLNEAEPA